MNIRSILTQDIPRLKELHEKFFKEEFDFPDFAKQFLCVFTVTDGDDIIVTGGVRPIAESVIITNKDYPIKVRREALNNMLQAHQYVASHYGYDGLHAFIQDTKWKEHLIKIGFRATKGQSIVLPL